MIRKAVFAVMLSGAVLTAPAQADVKAGVDAWLRGDYKVAIEQWRPLAIKGDPDAQFNLGQAYKLGHGVPVDLGLAEQWFGRAAAQGHPQAQTNYAIALFQNGKHDEAVPWLEKSVARGDPRAQLILGTMAFNGDAVAKDWVRAYALITRASAAGIPKASETLAQMDQYISTEERQRGIALARQYEASGQSPTPAFELAGASSSVRPAELPASNAGSGDPALSVTKPAVKPRSSTAAAATKPAPREQASTPPATSTAPVATSAPVTTPAQPVARGKGWRVQFGAFRDEGNARRLWESLKGRVSIIRTLQPFLVQSGSLTKLQAGPLASSAEATRVCGAARAAVPGTACAVVAP